MRNILCQWLERHASLPLEINISFVVIHSIKREMYLVSHNIPNSYFLTGLQPLLFQEKENESDGDETGESDDNAKCERIISKGYRDIHTKKACDHSWDGENNSECRKNFYHTVQIIGHDG